MAQAITNTLVDNKDERTPCVLVLDVSGSMGEVRTDEGRRSIDALNDGLKAFDQELKADSEARRKVQVLLIGVGGKATVLHNWVDASEFTPTELTAGGNTPLGEGVRLALEKIESQKTQYRAKGISWKRPFLIIMSDGAPTDEWETAAAQCVSAETEKKVSVFPVGVEGAAMDVLARFSTRGALPMATTKFKEFFVWLSASTAVVSKSAEGAVVALPPTGNWASVTA